MKAWLWLSVLSLVIIVMACTRTEEPAPSPAATPAAGATGVARTTAASPAAVATPATDEDDEDEDEVGPDFEIDADASSYTGWVPKTVQLSVKALNGAPPYTFTWDLGDGSPPETGEAVTHTYNKLGRIDIFVHAVDASGEKATFQLVLFLQTLDEYAKRKGLDPELLKASPSPVATGGATAGASPAPAATP